MAIKCPLKFPPEWGKWSLFAVIAFPSVYSLTFQYELSQLKPVIWFCLAAQVPCKLIYDAFLENALKVLKLRWLFLIRFI